MARSQETFNKKEKENQRAKKRKEKALKKEDRKSNSGKKSLDEMMAYVDENGNIVSAPPDPTLKRVINEEDIQIGVAKREDVEEEIKVGKVSFFNDSKGYGFIKDNNVPNISKRFVLRRQQWNQGMVLKLAICCRRKVTQFILAAHINFIICSNLNRTHNCFVR